MKSLLLFIITLISQVAFGQVVHGTRSEILIHSSVNWAILNEDGVGRCGLPQVTRGEEDSSLVDHRITIFIPGEGQYTLKTDYIFEYDKCEKFAKSLIDYMYSNQESIIPLQIRTTEKLVQNKGTYMGKAYCNQEHIKLYETLEETNQYTKTVKVSEGICMTKTKKKMTYDDCPRGYKPCGRELNRCCKY
jgi:hypothetical protein